MINITLTERFEPIGEAVSFAALHHKHQKRDGGCPYIAHPFRVCMTLRQVFGIDDVPTLAASLLHDLIEDTGVDYDDIYEHFEGEVADLVAGMTKDMRLREDLREPAYDEQIKSGSWKLKAIKLADVFDNLSDTTGGKVNGAIKKAYRAIACAEGEERLVDAVARVRELIGHFREGKAFSDLYDEISAEGGEAVEIKDGESFGGLETEKS